MSTKRELEAELAHLRDRVTALFQHSPDLIYVLDRDGKIFEINSAAGPMLRYSPEQLTELTYADLFVPEERAAVAERFLRVMQGEVQRFEARLRDVDEVPREFEVLAMPVVEHGEVVGAFGTARDISERKRLETALHDMAYRDHLTGLPNQRAMQRHLEHLLAAQLPFAVMILDLDRFKSVNDRFGHAVGDLLLRAVTLRLEPALPPNARLFRYGGDELVLVLQAAAEAEAIGLAELVQRRFAEPFLLKDKEVAMTTSIGIAAFPDDGNLIDTLFTQADNAMYFAKAHGRNTFALYRNIAREGAEQLLQLELELRTALRNGEVSLTYQPIVDAQTGALASMEALMRWHSPRLGDVSPTDFIPVAEETGLVVELGAWALDAACRQLGEWRRQGLGNVGVSVNVSIHQFYHQDFAAHLQQTLDRYGVDPSQLMLEITESVASNADAVVVQLERLKRMGVSVALDDFGTGYSSLQYLQRYPIDCVKIDRSFVADMETNEADRTLVATIISLAHSLGLRTVAEGVESPTQFALLRELGADLLQGTHFAEALEAEAAGEWIAHRATTREGSPRG